MPASVSAAIKPATKSGQALHRDLRVARLSPRLSNAGRPRL
jgi:hypothetical protein